MIDLHFIFIYTHINWPLSRENITDNRIFVAFVFVSVASCCCVSSLLAFMALMFPHSHQFVHFYSYDTKFSILAPFECARFLYIVIKMKLKEISNQSLNKHWQQWQRQRHQH